MINDDYNTSVTTCNSIYCLIFLLIFSKMTLSTQPTTSEASSEAKNVGPRTALDHKITATTSVLECVDKMHLISTFLDSLSDKLLSTTSRKGASAISQDLKKVSKVNSTIVATIKANAQKCAPVCNLRYLHNQQAVAKKQQQGATLYTKEKDSEYLVE